MKNNYRNALDKIKLDDSVKERAKNLFYETAPKHEKGRPIDMKIKKFLKPCLAIAAGVAIVITANAAVPAIQDKLGISSRENKNPDNYFSVTVHAKELSKTGKIFPDTYSSYLYTIGIVDDTLSFTFDFPVACKGKNIDTITYEIEEGALQVINEKGKSIVIEGEETDKDIDILDIPMVVERGYNGNYTRHYDSLNGWISTDSVLKENDEYKFYKSFTVKYDNQSNDTTRFNIIDTSNIWTAEKKKAYKNLLGKKNHDLTSLSLNEEKKLYDFLTKDLGITCTVTYKDGCTETKIISVANEICNLSDLFGREVQGDDKDIVCRFYHLG